MKKMYSSCMVREPRSTGPANGAASVLAEQLWIGQVTYREPGGQRAAPRR